jgi:hydrogenase nickel incorporation protein HypA/HybF
MHELSVCLSLLQQVDTIARERGATRVTSIELKIGPLSGVEADLLRNAYPLAAAGTVAQDAELRISEASIRVRCNTCGVESEAAANRLLCGSCGDFRTTVISGDEMILQSVELDTSQPEAQPAG